MLIYKYIFIRVVLKILVTLVASVSIRIPQKIMESQWFLLT